MLDPLLIFISALALSALLGAVIGRRWIEHVALCAAAIPPVYFAATMIMALATGSRDSSARADIGVIAMGLIWPMAVACIVGARTRRARNSRRVTVRSEQRGRRTARQ